MTGSDRGGRTRVHYGLTLPYGPSMRSCLFVTLLASLMLSTLECSPASVPLPEIDDPVFSSLSGVNLNMPQAAFMGLGRPIEPGPDGEIRESFGPGWITYHFSGIPDGRLVSIRWWLEYSDSLRLQTRWGELVSRISNVHPARPWCSRKSTPGMSEHRAVWEGLPAIGVSAQILSQGNGRGYRAELVVIAEIEGRNISTETGENTPCGARRWPP